MYLVRQKLLERHSSSTVVKLLNKQHTPIRTVKPKKALTLFTLNFIGYAISTATISLTLSKIKFLETYFSLPNSGSNMYVP